MSAIELQLHETPNFEGQCQQQMQTNRENHVIVACLYCYHGLLPSCHIFLSFCSRFKRNIFIKSNLLLGLTFQPSTHTHWLTSDFRPIQQRTRCMECVYLPFVSFYLHTPIIFTCGTRIWVNVMSLSLCSISISTNFGYLLRHHGWLRAHLVFWNSFLTKVPQTDHLKPFNPQQFYRKKKS